MFAEDKAMYVCLCKSVTDKQIKEIVYDGAQDLKDVRTQLGVASVCGKCAPMARQIIEDTRAEVTSLTDSLLYFNAAS